MIQRCLYPATALAVAGLFALARAEHPKTAPAAAAKAAAVLKAFRPEFLPNKVQARIELRAREQAHLPPATSFHP